MIFTHICILAIALAIAYHLKRRFAILSISSSIQQKKNNGRDCGGPHYMTGPSGTIRLTGNNYKNNMDCKWEIDVNSGKVSANSHFFLNPSRLYTVHCINCTVYSVHYTLYSVHYTVYSVHYTVYIIHLTNCTLFSVLIIYIFILSSSI